MRKTKRVLKKGIPGGVVLFLGSCKPGVSNLFIRRATCNLRMIARATVVFAAKTLLKLYNLRNVYFHNYKNNKRTNSKLNKVFATRRHFNVKFDSFFSNKLGNIRQDQMIFFWTKSVSDQKIRDLHVSDRGAPRIRQRRGAQPRVWRRSRQRGSVFT